MSAPTPSRSAHRVLIIEDHVLFAESLELTLSLEGYDVRRLPLPAEAGSLAGLRSAALRANPRTVLLDLDLGRFGDGMGLIAPLARAEEIEHGLQRLLDALDRHLESASPHGRGGFHRLPRRGKLEGEPRAVDLQLAFLSGGGQGCEDRCGQDEGGQKRFHRRRIQG